MTTAVLDYLWGQEPGFKVVEDCVKNCGKDCGHGKKSKNIVISFDGTSATPQDAYAVKKDYDGKVPLYVNGYGLSNICKLHLIAGGNIGNSKNYFKDQIPFYYQGVGTRGSSVGQLVRKIPGFSSGYSMNYIAKLAYEDLEKIYEEGDKLFVFGFSRGAATARLFASFLDKYEDKKFDYKINFLGVYDTVVASAMYSWSNKIENLDIFSKSNWRLPDVVERAVHFVSIDDHREFFDPTLFNADDRVTEIWVPGVHSDIGGGYYHDGISDTVLQCMQMEAEKVGLKTREITAETCKNEDYTLVEPVDGLDADAFREFDKDLKVEPDALDPDVHDQMSMAYSFANLVFGFFKHRKMVKMVENKPSEEPILLLDIAVDRVLNLQLDIAPMKMSTYASKKYRPENLKGVKYRVVSSEDMSVSEKVHLIEDQVSEW